MAALYEGGSLLGGLCALLRLGGLGIDGVHEQLPKGERLVDASPLEKAWAQRLPERCVQAERALPQLEGEPQHCDRSPRQRAKVRPVKSEGGAGQHRKGDAVLDAGPRIQDEHDEEDEPAEQVRHRRLGKGQPDGEQCRALGQ